VYGWSLIVSANSTCSGVYNHQSNADDDSRHEPAQKELAHRQFGIIGEHDHCDARGDDRPDRRGRSGDGDGVVLVVSLLLHGGNHDGSDGGSVGDAGALDAGEEHGTEDVNMAQPAAKSPDQRIGKIDYAVGDIALAHNEACQDEQRNRHKAEVVDAAEDIRYDKDERIAHRKGRDTSDQADRNEYRKAQEDQSHQSQKAKGDCQHADSASGG